MRSACPRSYRKHKFLRRCGRSTRVWSTRPNRLRTPARLVQELGRVVGDSGFSVAVDRLFSSCLVPTVCDEREPAVVYLMIELNRTLYMDQASAAKRPEPLGLFDTTMLYFVPPLTVVRRAEVTDARSSG